MLPQNLQHMHSHQLKNLNYYPRPNSIGHEQS
ncbi:hypothetical protein [Pseudomonas sp. NPDC087336]